MAGKKQPQGLIEQDFDEALECRMMCGESSLPDKPDRSPSRGRVLRTRRLMKNRRFAKNERMASDEWKAAAVDAVTTGKSISPPIYLCNCHKVGTKGSTSSACACDERLSKRSAGLKKSKKIEHKQKQQHQRHCSEPPKQRDMNEILSLLSTHHSASPVTTDRSVSNSDSIDDDDEGSIVSTTSRNEDYRDAYQAVDPNKPLFFCIHDDIFGDGTTECV